MGVRVRRNVGARMDNVILGILIAALAIWSASATLAAERHPPGAAAFGR